MIDVQLVVTGILFTVAALTLLAVLLLFRQFGLMYMGSRATVESEGIQVGDRAPVSPTVPAWSETPPHGVTAVFVATPDCEVGGPIFADLDRLAKAWPSVRFVATVPMDNGDRPRQPGFTARLSDRVEFDDQGELRDLFGLSASPCAVLVSPSGVVVDKQMLASAQHLSRLLAYQLDDRLGTILAGQGATL